MNTYYLKNESVDAVIQLYGNGKTMVQPGTRIIPSEEIKEGFALYSPSFSERIRLQKEGYIVDNVFVKKYTFNNLSIATEVILGRTCIPELEWKDEHGISIYETKEKKKAENKKKAKEEIKKLSSVDVNLFFEDEVVLDPKKTRYYMSNKGKKAGYNAVGYFSKKQFYLEKGSKMCSFVSSGMSQEARSLRKKISSVSGEGRATLEDIPTTPEIAAEAISGTSGIGLLWRDENGRILRQ